MRVLLSALLLLFVASTAQAQLTLCNRTSHVVQVAATEDEADDDVVEVFGWTAIAAGKCVEVSASIFYDHAFFAYQPATGRVWEDDEEGAYLCVRIGRDFNIRYRDISVDFEGAEDFDCPSGAEQRGFLVFPNEHENVTFDLK